MKQNYKKILVMAMIAIGMKANAQCAGCSITISMADASNYIVSAGQTLCVTSTGIASGLITVSAGGTLCNMGTINSSNIWVAGGIFNNYNVVNTTNILVNGQGMFTNYNTANASVDSLLVSDFNSAFMNYGILTGERLAATDASSITNFGDISEDYVGDSSAQFNNNHNLWIAYDFANAYNSGFFNAGYMRIDRDFFNSTGSTFETDCMVNVGRDWYNSAIINGPAGPACGGFNIANLSLNSGTVGTMAQNVDLCDATHVGPGIDGNSGTIAGTTTYCACTNNCVVMAGINEPLGQSNVLISNLYPNPANNSIALELLNNKSERLKVELIDMMGRRKLTSELKSTIGQNKMNIDISAFAQGTYILSITDEQGLQAKKMFSVVK